MVRKNRRRDGYAPPAAGTAGIGRTGAHCALLQRLAQRSGVPSCQSALPASTAFAAATSKAAPCPLAPVYRGAHVLGFLGEPRVRAVPLRGAKARRAVPLSSLLLTFGLYQKSAALGGGTKKGAAVRQTPHQRPKRVGYWKASDKYNTKLVPLCK